SRACADYGLPSKTFARDARAALGAYEWPGNVRELANIIERVALLGDDSVVTAAMLALPVTNAVDDQPAAETVPANTSRDRTRVHLLEVLGETGWNISQTASRLGVARNTVLARMARFGLRNQPTSPRRRDAPATSQANVSVPLVATSRVAWEPRRVALLRVDVVADMVGASDVSRT